MGRARGSGGAGLSLPCSRVLRAQKRRSWLPSVNTQLSLDAAPGPRVTQQNSKPPPTGPGKRVLPIFAPGARRGEGALSAVFPAQSLPPPGEEAGVVLSPGPAWQRTGVSGGWAGPAPRWSWDEGGGL